MMKRSVCNTTACSLSVHHFLPSFLFSLFLFVPHHHFSSWSFPDFRLNKILTDCPIIISEHRYPECLLSWIWIMTHSKCDQSFLSILFPDGSFMTCIPDTDPSLIDPLSLSSFVCHSYSTSPAGHIVFDPLMKFSDIMCIIPSAPEIKESLIKYRWNLSPSLSSHNIPDPFYSINIILKYWFLLMFVLSRWWCTSCTQQ